MTETIIQVLDSIEEEASGPSYTVPRLCAGLGASGADVRLLTLGTSTMPATGWQHCAYPPDFAAVPLRRRLRLSRALAAELKKVAGTACDIHTYGLWLMSNTYPAHAARRAGRPFILSACGMLAKAALEFSRGSDRGVTDDRA